MKMDKKEREDRENKRQNSWVDRLKQNVSGKIRDLSDSLQVELQQNVSGKIRNLSDSLQGKLRDLTLDELAQITRAIGTELNHLFMPVAAIAAELLRRIQEKPSTVEATAKAGSIVRVEKILPTMSKEEVEAKLKGLKDFIDESDAPSETKSLTFSMLESQSSKVVSELGALRSEVQNFEQTLKKIKGK